MIGIIDYGMGNLRSVQKALERVGGAARVVRSPADARELDPEKLVLPGVGAFGDGMAQLRAGGWDAYLPEFCATERPFLGVCLGMELLFEASEEDAPDPASPVAGLGVLPGRVRAFEPGREPDGRKRKVPHMGWNTLTWERADPLLAEVVPGAAVYFVHGYYVEPGDDGLGPVASAFSDHGGAFCASAWRGKIWATQFHPEKSQAVGLAMLRAFVGL